MVSVLVEGGIFVEKLFFRSFFRFLGKFKVEEDFLDLGSILEARSRFE